jgi:Uma2 family endonuclease
LLWTVDQFHFLGDLGIFEGRGVKLINGVIVEEGQMTPLHAMVATMTEYAIRDSFGKGWRVCIQMPLDLGPATDPVPDVAVIPGNPRDCTAHPTTASLVVEISEVSLNYNLTTKAELYATAGIADYWVVDVDGQRLLVLRDPAHIAAGGAAYRTQITLNPTDSIAPLAMPASSVRVADLLP